MATAETLSIVVKTEGINKAKSDISRMGDAAEAAEKKVQKLVTAVDDMARKFAAGATGTKALTDALAVTNRSTKASDTAMKELNKSIGVLSSQIGVMATRMQAGNSAVNTSTVNIRHHTAAMTNAHAAARGLTGALGALWLTYGNIAPLAAGAAVGASFKQIISQGLEFQNTLKGIEVRGQETAESMKELKAQIDSLGQGIYGPLEVAKAFETLILAGLNARKAVEAIGPTLNFAVAGAVPIEKAAFTLVQVSTALGYTAEGFGRVGDVIAKTAAVSMSSVESLSEAFKSASSVGVVFGLSITDIATSLASLSNLGIQGSAAGTALKNMFKELDSSSDRVRKTLEAVGINVERDLKEFGKFKDINTIFETISKGLDKFGDKGGKAMQAISNERGLRALAAGLQLYRKEVEESGTALQGLTKAIDDSAGYAALAAARISLTSKNQVEGLMNTLKTTFVNTFDAMQPQVNLFANTLRNVFKSEDFANGLRSVATALADFFVTLVKLIPVMVEAGKAFLVYKSAMIAAEVVTAAAKAWQGFAAAIVAVRTAALTLTGAFKGVAGVVAAAATAYYLFSEQRDKALDTTKTEEMIATNENFIESLKKEEERLDKNIKNLQEMRTVKEALARTNKELALSEIATKNAAVVDDAQKQYNNALKNVPAAQRGLIPSIYEKNAKGGYMVDQTKLSGDIPAAVRAYANLVKAQDEAKNSLTTIESTLDRIAVKYRKDAELTEAKRKEELKAEIERAKMLGNIDFPEGKGEDKPKGLNAFQTFIDSQSKWIAGHAARVSLLKQEGDVGKAAAVGQYEAESLAFLQSEAAMNAMEKLNGEQLKRYQLAILNKGIEKDNLKAEESKLLAYNELVNQIKDGNAAEEYRQKLESQGIDVGKYEGQVAAKAQGLKISEDQLKNDIAAAKLRDEQIKQQESLKRLESATASSKQRAEQYADETTLLDKYGQSVRQTAVEFAKAEIAKRNFEEGSAAGKERMGAAGLEDYALGLLNITKEYEELQSRMMEQDGVLLDNTIGIEQSKVLAYQNTKNKYIQFQEERVKAGLAAEVAAGTKTQAEADSAMALFQTKLDKLKALTQKSFDIDFKVAGLQDISDIFNNMADAADRMGDKFAGPVKALDKFSRGFDNLAKIEKKANGDSKKFAAERVGAYADMLDGAKNFFKEGTGGYKALEKASQVASAIQIAMNIKTMASNAASAVSGVIAGAAQMFAQSGWGGFAGVAAMLGVMAALGFSGGTSGVATPSAEERQKTQGTGSVFGDSSAKSESISKSLEYLKDNSDIMLPLTSQMAKSLQNIEASMAGLGNLILRTTGVTDGSNFGIKEGTFANGSATGSGLVTSAITHLNRALFGHIGDKITGALFGKTTRTITDSGISFGGTVDQLQAGQGYNQYVDVETKKKKLFGWSKSTKYSTETQALNDELSNQFALIFTSLEDSLKLAAGGLGKSGTEVGDAISNMVIEQTTLSLKGLKGDELTEAINSVISKTMDDIAKAAFPDLGGFQQVGEGYAQTVLRVASGIEQADVALDAFNITAIKYTDIVNKQGDVAAEIFTQSVLAVEGLSGVGDIIKNLTGDVSELSSTYKELINTRNQLNNAGLNGAGLNVDTIKGAGGLDNLGNSIVEYQENYFTELEQNNMKFADLTRQFKDLNITLPASKDALKALIQQASASGNQGLLGSLLALSGAFAEASDKAADLAQAEIDKARAEEDAAKDLLNKRLALLSQIADLEGNTAAKAAIVAQQRAIELSAMDASLKPLQERLWLLQDEKTALDKEKEALEKLKDAAKTGVDQALKTVQDSVNAQIKLVQDRAEKEKEVLQKQLESVQEFKSAIEDVFNSLSGAMDSTKVESEALNKARREGAQSYLASIRGTDLTKATGLNGALDALSGDSSGFFSTFEDYAFDQAKTATLLQSLTNQAESQKTFAELTVDRLNDTISAIDKSTEAEVARLQAILDKAQEQVNALNGITAAILTVPDALANLAAAIGNSKAVDASGGKKDNSSARKGIEALYQSILGRAADEVGMSYYLDVLSKGHSLEEIAQGMVKDYEFQGKLQGFAVGTNYVTEDMPAMIHEGERIMPKSDNLELMRRLDSADAKDAKIERLEAKLDNIAQVIMSGDAATVGHLRNIAKKINEWDGNGMPPERAEA